MNSLDKVLLNGMKCQNHYAKNIEVNPLYKYCVGCDGYNTECLHYHPFSRTSYKLTKESRK